MEPIILTNPEITPDNDLVFAIIGDKSILWQKIMSHLHENHKDISEVWRFYNDGKSWLFRVLKKKNTIFWVAVIEGTFRVGFYFSNKAEPLIENSDLPEKIKDEYRSTSQSKFRAVSVVINNARDAEIVIKLAELKLKVR